MQAHFHLFKANTQCSFIAVAYLYFAFSSRDSRGRVWSSHCCVEKSSILIHLTKILITKGLKLWRGSGKESDREKRERERDREKGKKRAPLSHLLCLSKGNSYNIMFMYKNHTSIHMQVHADTHTHTHTHTQTHTHTHCLPASRSSSSTSSGKPYGLPRTSITSLVCSNMSSISSCMSYSKSRVKKRSTIKGNHLGL